ncbi:MAG: phytoene/squalene synthase family protein [Salibacteraceae bacterium]
MKAIFDNVSENCSQEFTKGYSTSFSLAVKMLSPSIQGAIHSIYGFVRLADEIVDSFHDYDKEKLFAKLEVDLAIALKQGISLNPVLNAFQAVVHEYNIDNGLIDAFMKSMKADLHKSTYESVEDYEEYIYGSADVVGLMCLKVFVNGNQEKYDALKYSAMKLGSAFQKVNFLRDLKDDMETLDRTYFPHLQNRTFNQETKDEIVAEIADDFKEAYVGIKQLPLEARFGVYTAYVYYKRLLRNIINAEVEEVANNRIRVSNPVKIALLAKSFVSYKLDLI